MPKRKPNRRVRRVVDTDDLPQRSPFVLTVAMVSLFLHLDNPGWVLTIFFWAVAVFVWLAFIGRKDSERPERLLWEFDENHGGQDDFSRN